MPSGQLVASDLAWDPPAAIGNVAACLAGSFAVVRATAGPERTVKPGAFARAAAARCEAQTAITAAVSGAACTASGIPPWTL